MSTKNTILKAYDGRFKDIFQDIYEKYEVSGLGPKVVCQLALKPVCLLPVGGNVAQWPMCTNSGSVVPLPVKVMLQIATHHSRLQNS